MSLADKELIKRLEAHHASCKEEMGKLVETANRWKSIANYAYTIDEVGAYVNGRVLELVDSGDPGYSDRCDELGRIFKHFLNKEVLKFESKVCLFKK